MTWNKCIGVSMAVIFVAWLALNELRYMIVLSIRNDDIVYFINAAWYVISFFAFFAVGPVAEWLDKKINK